MGTERDRLVLAADDDLVVGLVVAAGEQYCCSQQVTVESVVERLVGVKSYCCYYHQ